MAKERGEDKYLAAYYVGRGEIAETEIRGYLAGVLPEYMVPSAYVRLEKLPLSANGKLDRRALPEVEMREEGAYQGPENEEEEKLQGYSWECWDWKRKRSA